MHAFATRAPRAARPARSGIATLPALEALDRTHRQMIERLADLQQLVEHLEQGGTDGLARSGAAALCSFFAEHARQHHAEEERLVFPALLAGDDAELAQHVRRLQQDHGWLEEDWLELAPQLQAVAAGSNGVDLDLLRHIAGIFVALYQEHIALEESLIYPAARRRLGLPAATAAAPSSS